MNNYEAENAALRRDLFFLADALAYSKVIRVDGIIKEPECLVCKHSLRNGDGCKFYLQTLEKCGGDHDKAISQGSKCEFEWCGINGIYEDVVRRYTREYEQGQNAGNH